MESVLAILAGVMLGVINGIILWKIADFIGSRVTRFFKMLIRTSEKNSI